MQPDSVKRIASLVPAGQTVRVVAPGEFEVSDKPLPEDVKRAELDEQIRAGMAIVASLASTVKELAERTQEAVSGLKDAAESVKTHHETLVKALERVEKAMAQDVEPIYKDGKLIGARRVKSP